MDKIDVYNTALEIVLEELDLLLSEGAHKVQSDKGNSVVVFEHDVLTFIGNLASVQPMYLLRPSVADVDVIFDNVNDEEQETILTGFVYKLSTILPIRLNSIEAGAYERLEQITYTSYKRMISSPLFDSDIKERLDLELIKDTCYLALLILRDGCHQWLVESNRENID